jgi:hypothetical protein
VDTVTPWTPLGARRPDTYRHPAPGDLIGYEHAVWKITAVTFLQLSDDDRDIWTSHGKPDLATWRRRPYRVNLQHIAGAQPDWLHLGDPRPAAAVVDIRAAMTTAVTWHIYPPSGRWPMCSCCLEPMPCRSDVQDAEIAAGMNRIEILVARQPGNCWACTEPITHRQKSITYPGDNLDLPGGPEVRYHTRTACIDAAERYEERWLAEDPRRQRTLTWPRCDGWLLVHHDGTTECRPDDDQFSGPSAPDCQGHNTHQHGSTSACLAYGPCPRGCPREGHPGTTPAPRPPRSSQASLI